MKTIQVPDMMCEHCVQRISAALSEAGMRFQISLPEKQVQVDGDPDVACGILEDLGFSPVC